MRTGQVCVPFRGEFVISRVTLDAGAALGFEKWCV